MRRPGTLVTLVVLIRFQSPKPKGSRLRTILNTCIPPHPRSLAEDPHPPQQHLTYHEHAEVRQMAGHAKDSGLQVLLMASQVDEGNHLSGFLTDLCPLQAATVAVWFVYHISFTVKAQNVVAHTAGATRLNLMFVAEEFLAGKASPIVQLPVCQDPQKRAFAGIHVAHDRYPACTQTHTFV